MRGKGGYIHIGVGDFTCGLKCHHCILYKENVYGSPWFIGNFIMGRSYFHEILCLMERCVNLKEY